MYTERYVNYCSIICNMHMHTHTLLLTIFESFVLG